MWLFIQRQDICPAYSQYVTVGQRWDNCNGHTDWKVKEWDTTVDVNPEQTCWGPPLPNTPIRRWFCSLSVAALAIVFCDPWPWPLRESSFCTSKAGIGNRFSNQLLKIGVVLGEQSDIKSQIQSPLIQADVLLAVQLSQKCRFLIYLIPGVPCVNSHSQFFSRHASMVCHVSLLSCSPAC